VKTRLFSLMTLLVLLAGLLPATAAFADGNDGNYQFQGTIETLPTDIHNGPWTVSGRTVRVTNATQIDQEHGPVAVGAYVEVKGWLQGDGSVDATKIDVKSSPGGGGGDDNGYLKYYGTVESLPNGTLIGDWSVSGRTVHVTAATQIDQEHGAVAVNAYVEVKGSQRADQSMDASKIEVKMGAGSGDSGRSYTQFNGTVSTMPANGGLVGDWTIDGRTVHVDAATRFEQEHGLVTVGANVEVKGWLEADTSITAVKIEVKDSSGGDGSGGSGSGSVHDKFHGTVQQLPANGLTGTWIVSERAVNVSSSTRIDQEHGQVVVGAYVEVEGLLVGNSVNATKIDVQDSPGGGDNHDSNTRFYGTVNSFPPGFVGTWNIGGRIVTTTATTVINQEHGPVAVDAYVEVEGTLQADGSVAATKIEVKSSPGTGGGSGSVGYAKFYGVIEDLPVTGGLVGDWMVSTRIVHVSATTPIDQEHGAVRRGASVEVKGIQEADGSVTATKIEVKN